MNIIKYLHVRDTKYGLKPIVVYKAENDIDYIPICKGRLIDEYKHEFKEGDVLIVRSCPYNEPSYHYALLVAKNGRGFYRKGMRDGYLGTIRLPQSEYFEDYVNGIGVDDFDFFVRQCFFPIQVKNHSIHHSEQWKVSFFDEPALLSMLIWNTTEEQGWKNVLELLTKKEQTQ